MSSTLLPRFGDEDIVLLVLIQFLSFLLFGGRAWVVRLLASRRVGSGIGRQLCWMQMMMDDNYMSDQ